MPRERIRRGHDVYTHLQNFTFLFTRFLLQFTLALIYDTYMIYMISYTMRHYHLYFLHSPLHLKYNTRDSIPYKPHIIQLCREKASFNTLKKHTRLPAPLFSTSSFSFYILFVVQIYVNVLLNHRLK